MKIKFKVVVFGYSILFAWTDIFAVNAWTDIFAVNETKMAQYFLSYNTPYQSINETINFVCNYS